jgi:predicted flavoprotein YhiN
MPAAGGSPQGLAAAIKRLPVPLLAPRPLAEAISTAGGVRFEALDHRLMCRSLPGVFCAGEMLDWEAPTGGYLLTACFATGRAAAIGALEWVEEKRGRSKFEESEQVPSFQPQAMPQQPR